jgi:hypothetical protein
MDIPARSQFGSPDAYLRALKTCGRIGEQAEECITALFESIVEADEKPEWAQRAIHLRSVHLRAPIVVYNRAPIIAALTGSLLASDLEPMRACYGQFDKLDDGTPLWSFIVECRPAGDRAWWIPEQPSAQALAH